jgi:S1/P1 Nuclease
VADVAEVAETLPEADSTSAHHLVTSAWTNESFADAQAKVYVPPVGEGNGPFHLTAAYQDAAKQEAKQRIALAGARLANLLNEELR